MSRRLALVLDWFGRLSDTGFLLALVGLVVLVWGSLIGAAACVVVIGRAVLS